MCLEDDVPTIEEERICCPEANYSIVPKEKWDNSDWVELYINILEDYNHHDELEKTLPEIRLKSPQNQIKFIKDYLDLHKFDY